MFIITSTFRFTHNQIISALAIIVSFSVGLVAQSVKSEYDNKVAVFVNKDATIGYLGSVESVPGGQLVAAFRGIPYAEPPVGKLRFMVF